MASRGRESPNDGAPGSTEEGSALLAVCGNELSATARPWCGHQRLLVGLASIGAVAAGAGLAVASVSSASAPAVAQVPSQGMPLEGNGGAAVLRGSVEDWEMFINSSIARVSQRSSQASSQWQPMQLWQAPPVQQRGPISALALRDGTALRELEGGAKEPHANKKKLLQAQCAVDITGILTVFTMSVKYIWNIAASDNLRCPDSTKEGCAVAVTTLIQMLAFLTSVISSSASTCKGTLDPRSLCSASISGMVSALAGIASAGQKVEGNCVKAKEGDGPAQWRHHPHVEELVKRVMEGHHHPESGGQAFSLPRPSSAVVPRALRGVMQHQGSAMEAWLDAAQRGGDSKATSEKAVNPAAANWRTASCAIDVVFLVDVLMASILRLVAMADDCSDNEACLVDVEHFFVFVSFSVTAISGAIANCPEEVDYKAVCSSNIAMIISNVGLLATLGVSIDESCSNQTKVLPELAPV